MLREMIRPRIRFPSLRRIRAEAGRELGAGGATVIVPCRRGARPAIASAPCSANGGTQTTLKYSPGARTTEDPLA